MVLRVLATIDQYWPTADYHNMCDEAKLLKVFASVVSAEEFPKLIERLMSLSRSDQRSLIHKMWETADEMYLHDENDKTTKTEDPYKDLPYEGKMVGSVYRTPRDE